MQFRTEVPIPNTSFTIEYNDVVFCLGSCFVSEIGKKLQEHKFRTFINPFGTLFHPLGILNNLSRIYTNTPYQEQEIFKFRELYFSWDHSQWFSNPKKNEILQNVNQTLSNANEILNHSTVFIITLGTAWAYYLKEIQMFVSNCHKIPQKNFDKKLSSVEEIHETLNQILAIIYDLNPKAKIIFTLSPVRHIKDGFVENQSSKGILHQAIYQICQENKEIYYFPSYEIVLDELRDYRFYKEDMVHVNDLGVNYLWEKFSQNLLSPNTLQVLKEIKNINSALEHKPINPGSVEHKKFLYDTLKKAENLSLKLPKRLLYNEIAEIKNRIHVH